MNILVINGSPRGEASNTIQLTKAFIRGIASQTETKVQNVTIVAEDIKPCVGCFSCWGATPGQCVIKDGMEAIREKVLWADVIIESFPLYFFGMPSQMKMFTDRMVPFTQSYCGESAEGKTGSLHEMRHNLTTKKMVVISTCGYTNTYKIYESLRREYDCICGPNGYTFLTCPQGEMFHVEQLKEITAARLDRVADAGAKWAQNMSVSEELREEIAKPLIPQRAFEMILKANWKKAKEDYDAKHHTGEDILNEG